MTLHLSPSNPFKPGAGHMPPYLAGREVETDEFEKLLAQETILSNMILTGLRGVGKTVLLDTFKPIAIQTKWLWVGTDLSESASVTEDAFANRLITDLAVLTSQITVKSETVRAVGFTAAESVVQHHLNYQTLIQLYNSIPGLALDKLKGVLEVAWNAVSPLGFKGIVFAYDEAQTMSDHAQKEQYPLSLLLDLFQSIQKKGVPFMLLLVGLPTLFPKCVNSRTFSERMFRVVLLGRLNEKDSRDAVLKPFKEKKYPVEFSSGLVDIVIKESGGYPYFIQFICREAFDILLQKVGEKRELTVPIEEITRKLDKDFFAGRWARVTDRQRELLHVVAGLETCDDEFTVQEVVEAAKRVLANPFTSSHVNQMLSSLSEEGLIYKNRHGKYSFAVPLLGRFILRQKRENDARRPA